MENYNKDEVQVNFLALKGLGEAIKKIKFHLDAAIDEYKHVEKKREQIEKETGIKMQFLSE